MSTRLIQVITFANVGAGATVALPHNINVNGTAKKPDFVAADVAGFTITVTATQVTVTNTGDVPASVNVWLELKHSMPRELGGAANLSPQPFIASSGSGGGGGSPTIIVQEEGVPLPNNPFTALNFIGAGVTAADAGGGVAGITVPGASAPVTDNSITGAGTGGDPFTVHPGGLNNITDVVGIAKPTLQTVLFDDCLNPSALDFIVTGGGQAVMDADVSVTWPCIGIATIFTSNPANYAATIQTKQQGGTRQVDIENLDIAVFQARVGINGAPPTNLADYNLLIGWTSQPANALNGMIAFTGGIENMGNANWWVKMNSATPQRIDTGIPIDGNGTPHIYTIIYTKSAAQMKFYYDGTLVGTITVPPPGSFGGPYTPYSVEALSTSVNSAGANLSVDWMYFRGDRDRS